MQQVDEQNARLNAAYQSALKRHGNALRQAQRAWLRWVGLQCELGFVADVAENGVACRLIETARQAEWLEGISS
jgi:uncharacterized protein YecT (DUF1311 family)